MEIIEKAGDKEHVRHFIIKRAISKCGQISKVLLEVSNLFLPLRKIFIFAKWSNI